MTQNEILTTFKKQVIESLVTKTLAKRLTLNADELEDSEEYVALFANLGTVIFNIDRADNLTEVYVNLSLSDVQEDIKIPEILIRILNYVHG